MDTVLLVIQDWNLRQLYHELLFSENIEVVPTDTVGNTTLMLMTHIYKTIIMYEDEKNIPDIETFLELRNRHTAWSTIKIILISTEEKQFKRFLKPHDVVVNPLLVNSQEIVKRIKKTIEEI